MAYISRDPFARQELHRHVVADQPSKTCDWCGNTRKNGTLFQYRTESDGGSTFIHRGLFCSKGCHDAYHN